MNRQTVMAEHSDCDGKHLGWIKVHHWMVVGANPPHDRGKRGKRKGGRHGAQPPYRQKSKGKK